MSKVSVIGCGKLGEAIASAVVIGGDASDLVMYDIDRKKAEGVVLDFNHGQLFHNTRVILASDYIDTAGSDIVVIAAGERKQVGQNRRDLFAQNKKVLEDIIPSVVKASPDCIIFVVTDPVDQLTQVAARLSDFPTNRVFGAGTCLDSSRFRSEVARRLDVKPGRVHAYLLGEHGDASVLPLSCALVGGIHLADVMPMDSIKEAHRRTKTAADDVTALRGYTSTASGAVVAKIIAAVLKDTRDIFALSTSAKGRLGIHEDVYISLPCVVGRDGTKHWNLDLPEEEMNELRQAAKEIYDVQQAAAHKN